MRKISIFILTVLIITGVQAQVTIDLEAPEQVSPDEGFSVTMVMSNEGEQVAYAWPSLELSGDQKYSADSGINVPNGEQEEITTAIRSPEKPGTYILRAELDNNHDDSTVSTLAVGSDLFIESFSHATGNYQTGDTVTSEVTIKNYRDEPASFAITYPITGPEFNSYNQNSAAAMVEGLGPGETTTKELSWTIPENAEGGRYDLSARVYESESLENPVGQKREKLGVISVGDTNTDDFNDRIKPFINNVSWDVSYFGEGENVDAVVEYPIIAAEFELRNPLDKPAEIEVKYTREGEAELSSSGDSKRPTLEPGETRIIRLTVAPRSSTSWSKTTMTRTTIGPVKIEPEADFDDDIESDDITRELTLECSRDRVSCEDTDGDGVADTNDECPEESGTEENNGCPEESSTSEPSSENNEPDSSNNVDLPRNPESVEYGEVFEVTWRGIYEADDGLQVNIENGKGVEFREYVQTASGTKCLEFSWKALSPCVSEGGFLSNKGVPNGKYLADYFVYYCNRNFEDQTTGHVHKVAVTEEIVDQSEACSVETDEGEVEIGEITTEIDATPSGVLPGQTVQIQTNLGDTFSDQTYKIQVENPSGETVAESEETNQDQKTLEHTPSEDAEQGEYTAKLKLVEESVVSRVIRTATGKSIPETAFSVSEDNLAWMQHCRQQEEYGADSIAGRATCIEEQIIPRCFETPAGEQCQQIGQSICQDLLDAGYSTETTSCEY